MNETLYFLKEIHLNKKTKKGLNVKGWENTPC